MLVLATLDKYERSFSQFGAFEHREMARNTRVSLGSQVVSLEEVMCVSEVKELDNHDVLLGGVRLCEIVQELGH